MQYNKPIVISCSLTGNNEALAERIAKEFPAEHIKIIEPKTRKISSIVLDLIFNRTPQVQPTPDQLENYDFILFLGPIWMRKIATPLRAYFKYLKINPHKYAFISISGGADGSNLKLKDELIKRVKQEPLILIDMHIADLLPTNPKPTRKDTSAYHLNNGDIKNLTDIIIERLREAISKQ
jgi:flavodoxin